MRRRAFLTGSVAVTTALAGCGAIRGRVGTDEADGGFGDGRESTPSLPGGDDSYGAGFSEGGAWPTHCFDAGRRGRNPDTEVPEGDVGTAWLRTPVEGERTFRTTAPVTDDSRVYVGSGSGADEEDGQRGGFVAAFDGETGERAWRQTVTAGTVEGVAYADGSVLAVSTSRDPTSAALTALASADGRERWRVELPHFPSRGPIVADGRAYVTSSGGGGGLTAVGLDGERRLTRPVADGDGGDGGDDDAESDERASTAPCGDGSSVYVGTDRGRVVAFDADDGSHEWREMVVDGGHRPRIQTIPTVVDGTVFVTGTDYRLYAVDADDGTTRWSTRLLDQTYGNSIPSVAVVDDAVYVNTIHGGLLALRRSDGAEKWRTGEHGGNLPPAAAGDVVVAPEGDSVTAYDSTGSERWSVEMRAFDVGMAAYIMRPQVALAHNRAYVSLNDGRVFSIGSR